MTADNALRAWLRPWGGERYCCELDTCQEPIDDDRPAPCEHGALLCSEHADQCRGCCADRADDRWEQAAVDAELEERAS